MIEFEEQGYDIRQVKVSPEWALEKLNTFLSENKALRQYLDIAKVRRDLEIPDDYPDDYIQDWFGHPDFGRH
jgi:hypothetical protein